MGLFQVELQKQACRRTRRRPGSCAGTCPTATAASGSTASTLAAAATPEDSTTTASTSTSTTPATSERWDEELPRALEHREPVLPGREPRQAVDARVGADEEEVREELQEGPRHRRV